MLPSTESELHEQINHGNIVRSSKCAQRVCLRKYTKLCHNMYTTQVDGHPVLTMGTIPMSPHTWLTSRESAKPAQAERASILAGDKAGRPVGRFKPQHPSHNTDVLSITSKFRGCRKPCEGEKGDLLTSGTMAASNQLVNADP